MVWGMEIPSTFGDFWPRGGYEGLEDNWAKRLDAYFNERGAEEKAVMLAELRKAFLPYSIYVSKKLKSEPGSKVDGKGFPFLPVEPFEVPEFYQAEKSSTSLGSLIALNYGILAVYEKLKAIIERLEPGVHEFFPIGIRMPKGKAYPVKYYILLITRYLDSLSIADSNDSAYKSYPDSPGYHTLQRRPPSAMSGLALKKSVFGDSHLWRERNLNEALTCFSDELHTQAKSEGLRLPKQYKMREV